MEPSTTSPDKSTVPRRGFLAGVASIIIGGLIVLTPLATGITCFLDPILRRKTKFKGADADGFLSVAKLTDLPDDGTPLRFVLRADKIDAWNKFKNQTIGTVYVRKIGDQVIAFNDTCPHLGCKVDYQESHKSFLCPCHASAFELDGKPTNKIPPRGLDSLEIKTDATGQVWVKYQDFQCGVKKQKEVQ